jgi:hypothetical protein
MTELTYDANLRFKGQVYTEQFKLDTTAGDIIYRGTAMLIVGDVDTENVVPFTGSMTVDTDDVFVGIAAEQKTVVTADPETTVINVYVYPTIVGFKMPASTTFTHEDLGKRMAFDTSLTLSATESASGNCEIGTCYRIEDGYVYVALDTPFIQANA